MSVASPKLSSSAIRDAARPLSGNVHDYDSLLAFVTNARLCLLGEATHGTHEFYRERAEITKRLIKEKGFNAVAVEADWPDAFRVNRYVRGLSDDENANEALGGFKRFPTWMWRNTVIVDFDARLSEQFDVVIHFDETQALEPLEREALWESGEPPETFPTGV
jgi:erythromycin esterase-like protein